VVAWAHEFYRACICAPSSASQGLGWMWDHIVAAAAAITNENSLQDQGLSSAVQVAPRCAVGRATVRLSSPYWLDGKRPKVGPQFELVTFKNQGVWYAIHKRTRKERLSCISTRTSPLRKICCPFADAQCLCPNVPTRLYFITLIKRLTVIPRRGAGRADMAVRAMPLGQETVSIKG
jgi:hypothetical protein